MSVQAIVTCDGCGYSTKVEKTVSYPTTKPEGWSQILITYENTRIEWSDVCPKCVKRTRELINRFQSGD